MWLVAPCSVTGATRNAGPEHVLVADIRHFRVVWKIHEKRSHVRRARLVSMKPERVDVRHQLIAQTQILLEDGLGLFAIRPDLIVFSLSVRPHDRLEHSPLEPTHKELGIVFVAVDVFLRV